MICNEVNKKCMKFFMHGIFPENLFNVNSCPNLNPFQSAPCNVEFISSYSVKWEIFLVFVTMSTIILIRVRGKKLSRTRSKFQAS